MKKCPTCRTSYDRGRPCCFYCATPNDEIAQSTTKERPNRFDRTWRAVHGLDPLDGTSTIAPPRKVARQLLARGVEREVEREALRAIVDGKVPRNDAGLITKWKMLSTIEQRLGGGPTLAQRARRRCSGSRWAQAASGARLRSWSPLLGIKGPRRGMRSSGGGA
jgi:hypothetical protein